MPEGFLIYLGIGMLSFNWINEDVKAVSLLDHGKEFMPTWEAVRQ
jgi:hypothetical protein